MSDWSKEWYNKKFHDMEANPSPQSWDNIRSELNEWPSHWYKSNAESIKASPKPNVWHNISTEIVPKAKPLFYRGNTVVFSLIFLLLFSIIPIQLMNEGVFKSFKNQPLQYSSVDLTQGENEQIFDDKKPTNSTSKTQVFSQKKDQHQINKDRIKEDLNDVDDAAPSQPNQGNTSDFPVENESNQKDKTLNKRPLLDPYKKIKPLTSYLAKNSVHQKDLIELPTNPTELEKNKHKWSVSVYFKPQASILVNPVTVNFLKGSEQISLGLGKSITYGLQWGRKINDKDMLFASFEMNNQRQQNTTKKHLNSESITSLNLKYSTIMVNYMHQTSLFKPERKSHLNIYGGLYFSYLNVVTQNESEPIFDLSEGFKNHDYGLSLGVEVTHDLSKDFTFFYGLNQQFGILDIFKGTSEVPAAFFKSSTQSIGLKVGLRKSL